MKSSIDKVVCSFLVSVCIASASAIILVMSLSTGLESLKCLLLSSCACPVNCKEVACGSSFEDLNRVCLSLSLKATVPAFETVLCMYIKPSSVFQLFIWTIILDVVF